MATLILRSAGAAIGTALGGPLGGFLGGALGAVGGAVVDSLLARALTPRRSTPQLSELPITNASESVVLHKLWGRMRLGGNVIWCSQFDTFTTSQSTGSGKGSLLGAPKTKVTHYRLSFAVAFCEGGDTVSLGRVWADGNELDMSKFAHTFHNGSEAQAPDSVIESVEGVGNVPAYRGTCYLVFHNMTLDDFGNRMPQITAELIRRSPYAEADDITNQLKAVCLLPGAGEFVLGTREYQSSDGFGNWFPENQHQKTGLPDFYGSMDELAAALPGRQAISLVVAWFGTDLRAGQCRITPKVETRAKTVKPADWAVAGFTRSAAPVVSQISPAALDPTGITGGSTGSGTVPAFGGTPSDATVTQAIRYCHAVGIRVMFYPFVMMDIPGGNGLPDPHGGPEQAAFPWRGRITCDPGPAQAGTADRTAAAAAQVNAFFAQYGPMVEHYARLCVAAGGVDSFVIGSELVGLTRLRAAPGEGPYPAVQALKALAASVKAIVGPSCKVGYAADWSEYHSHRPADGSGDVVFNMDPLWSDPHIDFIGIDNYLPLSDWRDGTPNRDAEPAGGPTTIYDKAYLAANVEGGEDYAWYYASDADRVVQARTPIADTAHGEDWVFRQKDIRSWWQNGHRSRPAGVRNGAATSYVPEGKPIWFTEFGCPAVDKGTNQPNVFYDPKSSESVLPYFSLGSKDDAIQRAYLEVTLAYWRDHAPVSSVYGGPMVQAENMYAWAWDARPYPDFPALAGVWHDTPNYELGHWLTGRLEVPMPAFALTASWLKIASAGQAVEVQNLSAAPILITTSSGPPATLDGLLLDALDTRIFALVADLYARPAGAAPGTVEVMGGFTLPGVGAVVPFAMTVPLTTGTPQPGQLLSASQGSWSGSPTVYAYQWARGGTAIAGATGATYTVAPADLGASLTVTVTATNAVGSATATSAALVVGAGSSPGGGAANTADFTEPNNAYLAALAAQQGARPMAAVPSVAFPFKGSDTNSYTGQTVPLDAGGNVPVSFATQPLPAGAATAARQPAFGVAGTAAADVLTVQGAVAGVALPADTVVRAAAANRGGLSPAKATSAAVTAGGTGYAVGDTITNAAGVFTVGTVTGGAVTAVTVTTPTALTATPSGALAQTATSGAGTGCTLTPTYAAAAVQFAAANAGRRGFAIQNQSGSNLWLSGTGTATADQNSLLLAPGDYFESSPHHTGTGALSVIGTAAGQPFYAREF